MSCRAEISFGLDVRRPGLLETRSTGAVLLGVRDGQWREAVARVRELPADSAEQKAAKIQLPFCTWAGVFSRRSNDGLVNHSGQVGIDLDGLGEAGAVAVLQVAVADVYCLAAFRSARGEGIRLIFRIPPCSHENHIAAFVQVREHVANTYGRNADESGKDVARASFVSFDNGLWLNAAALVLPIQLPGETQRLKANTRCVSSPLYSGQLAEVWPGWYGRHCANTTSHENGMAKTHGSLLDLGKSLALHAERIKTPLTARLIDAAFDAWLGEYARQGVRLRCQPDEYRCELQVSVRGAERKPWFKAAAEKWTRWTRHKQFPSDGLPHEQMLFANRRNARKSTGPKNSAITRYNAIKHGLLAKGLTELDSPETFTNFCAKIAADFKPVGEIENFLVRRIALGMVRLNRAAALEAEFITAQLHSPVVNTDEDWRDTLNEMNGDDTDPDLLSRISNEAADVLANIWARYETTLENRLHRSLNQLERLQRLRHGEKISPPVSLDIAVHG